MSSEMKLFVVILAIFVSTVLGRSKGGPDFVKTNKKESSFMLAEIAKELIQRSSSSSQVLNLNLSNLLLLLLLKAVVFGAGYIGNHGYKGRELDEESVISEGEMALALGYLMGDTCLYRAACEAPNKAREYLGAAEMILQTVKLLPRSFYTDPKYDETLAEFRKAIEYGETDECPPRYNCKKENIKNFLRPENTVKVN